jgi:hypothetical protein
MKGNGEAVKFLSGKYVSVQKLGQTTTAITYLVQRKKHPNDGAFFVLKHYIDEEEQDLGREQVSQLEQYETPNIIAYKDSFNHEGRIAVLTEYCNGKTFDIS